MPSFDVVSEVDKHHLTNAVDQANRQVTNRYDFKGVDARFERNEYTVTLVAEAEFQITQMLDILQSALLKNMIDIACLDYQPIKTSGKEVKQEILVRTGIETELAKKIVKMLKEQKLKVQAQIQGDQVRISGKKRDDLQAAIAFLREAELELPLQFINFRD